MSQKKISLSIITPERVVLPETHVNCVSLPAFGGEMGILPGHASFVVQLKEGVLRYHDGIKAEIFSVLSGYAEIHRDKVTVLAEAAELAEEINEERARQSETQAKEKLLGRDKDLDLDEATAALRRAGARMKAARLHSKDKRHTPGPGRLPGG
jgi:F-type H+-transporting ATPase subunit epsilon